MSEQLKGITATVAKVLAGESTLPFVGGPDLCIFAHSNTDLYIRRTKPSIIVGRPEGRSWDFWMVTHSNSDDCLWYVYCAMANAIMNRETADDQMKATEFLKEASSIGQMAFWENDRYPFFLHGVITTDKKGRVETVGYGKGHWFVPKFILPREQGEILANELAVLECQRNHELNLVRVRYKAHLDLAIQKYQIQIRTPNI